MIAISDTAGNPVARRGYGTYGETDAAQITGATTHLFGYTGRRWDPDLNLYYYRARWYDPTLGTFLQTDPIGSLDYINLYSYVGAEPGNATDPSGMCTGSNISNKDGTCAGGGFISGASSGSSSASPSPRQVAQAVPPIPPMIVFGRLPVGPPPLTVFARPPTMGPFKPPTFPTNVPLAVGCTLGCTNFDQAPTLEAGLDGNPKEGLATAHSL